MEGEDIREDEREEEWAKNTDGSSGDDSGAIDASTTGDDKYSMGGADGTLGAAEDGGGWRWVTRRCSRRGGKKVRAWSKEGHVM